MNTMLEELAEVSQLPDRLDQLSDAVANQRWNEFSMRVPAEPHRDADLVLALAARFIRTHHATIAQNADEVDKLRSLCAAVYQAAGTYDMPERFLDALSDAANGQVELRRKTDDLLPCDTPHNAEDPRRLKALEQAMALELPMPHLLAVKMKADEIMRGDSDDLIRN